MNHATPESDVAGAKEPLLAYLDARLRLTSAGGSHLSGRLCVGVRRGGQTRWWVAQLGNRPRAYFASQLPPEFDAGVLVDGSTAAWVLGAAAAPGQLHLVTGDTELLGTFLARHVGHASSLALRMTLAATSGSPRKGRA